MIREERFCGEMVEKVPSVQEETRARVCGIAGQGFPPAQGIGARSTPGWGLSCLGWFWKGRSIGDVGTSCLLWAEGVNMSCTQSPGPSCSLIVRTHDGNLCLLRALPDR